MPTLPSTSRDFQIRRLRSMTESGGYSSEYVRNSHWSARKYICPDCGETFTLKATLMRHKEFECNDHSYHQNLLKPKIEYDEKKPKKKHTCSQCKRTYSFFTSLWRHQKYECGCERKFACPVCRAKFAQKSNLDRHVRTRHWKKKIKRKQISFLIIFIQI